MLDQRLSLILAIKLLFDFDFDDHTCIYTIKHSLIITLKTEEGFDVICVRIVVDVRFKIRYLALPILIVTCIGEKYIFC